MAITDEFRAALTSEHRLDERRRAVVARLEALRTDLNDADEDVVLEVLDFVTGWCRPHARP